MAPEEKVGFVTMGAAGGGAEVETIGIGMLGYAFMGKAHSNAYKTLSYMAWPPPSCRSWWRSPGETRRRCRRRPRATASRAT